MASPNTATPAKAAGKSESWQQKRRVQTRALLLDAGAESFAAKGYDRTTVEDILHRAGVGRTSFYKHFDDKLAVAAALFEAFMPALEDAYASLAEHGDSRSPDVRAWLDRLIDRYADNGGAMKVFAEVMVREPGFADTISLIQGKIMRRLGPAFPRFAEAAATDDLERRTPASMILNLVDNLCSDIALRGALLDRIQAIDFVAHIVEEFIGAKHR